MDELEKSKIVDDSDFPSMEVSKMERLPFVWMSGTSRYRPAAD